MGCGVQAKGVDKTRRMFTGGEAINVIATNAIGHEVPIPVGLDQHGLRATAMLTPFVPGALSVAINISGEPIPVSPLVLQVTAGKLSARHCTVIPVTKDYASESTQVRLHAVPLRYALLHCALYCAVLDVSALVWQVEIFVVFLQIGCMCCM